jgi:hypothetical protein
MNAAVRGFVNARAPSAALTGEGAWPPFSGNGILRNGDTSAGGG